MKSISILIAVGVLIACTGRDVAPFPELDQDSNGRISEVEAAEDSLLVERFTQVDGDRDGQLSALEYLQAAAR